MLILGRVWTFDPERPRASAVAVRGDRVVAVGEAADLRVRYPAEPRVQADWITPGLHESHAHPLAWGLALAHLDLRGERDPHAVARRVAAAAAKAPAGAWILGGGYVFDAYPEADLLDAAAPQHPVFLESRDLHGAWVNRRALAAAGIGPQTPDPEGGRFLRDADGRPTGYLLERAVGRLREALPRPTRDDLMRGLEDLARRGFVAVHAMGEIPEASRWIRELARSGRLPLRVAWTERREQAPSWSPEKIGESLHVFGVKYFADGALTSRTAWMLAPYPDGGHGMPLDDPRQADEEVAEALARGFAPVWHAIGSRALRELLDLVERLEARGLPVRERMRVEHVQHVVDADLPRLAGLALSVQPQHARDDRAAIERLGPGRAREAYRWGAFAALPGVSLLLGSDAPVAPPDPAEALSLAQDHPLPGIRGVSLDQALEAFTHAPAAFLGWHREAAPWGVIRPGARAAMTLWDRSQPVARLWRNAVEPL